MPYKLIWEDAPHDNNLPVIGEHDLPDGVTENERMSKWFMGHRREATGYIDDKYVTYHWCPKCNGWIPGHYYASQVNTLDSSHLAGRQGTEYFCRRCGYEVDFFGMMS